MEKQDKWKNRTSVYKGIDFTSRIVSRSQPIAEQSEFCVMIILQMFYK